MKIKYISAARLCKVRGDGTGTVRDDECRIFYSGPERRESNGVGVVLGKRLKETMKDDIIDHMLIVRLKGRKDPHVTVQIYMPTSEYSEDEVELHDKYLEKLIQSETQECMYRSGGRLEG